MKILYYLLPLIAGIAMSIQSGINSQLREAIQHPLMAAMISFLVGTFALGLLLLFYRQPLPPVDGYSAINWYKFTGGLLGAFIVLVALVSVSKIGASNMFVLIVAGQLITAVFMDYFGLLGLAERPINLQKSIGIVLLIAGAYLVNKN